MGYGHKLEKTFRLARRMMKAHAPMADIIAALGHRYTEQQIRDGVNGLADAVTYNNKALYKARRAENKKQTPHDVLADRERREHLRHASLTARLCGDPLPGRSALNRIECTKREFRRDPLDSLIFKRKAKRHGNVQVYG